LKLGQSTLKLSTVLKRRLSLYVTCQRNREDVPILTATALMAAAVKTQQFITVTEIRATKFLGSQMRVGEVVCSWRDMEPWVSKDKQAALESCLFMIGNLLSDRSENLRSAFLSEYRPRPGCH
jgi:hypothetical protein